MTAIVLVTKSEFLFSTNTNSANKSKRANPHFRDAPLSALSIAHGPAGVGHAQDASVPELWSGPHNPWLPTDAEK